MRIIQTKDLFLVPGLFYVEKYDNKIICFSELKTVTLIKPIKIEIHDGFYSIFPENIIDSIFIQVKTTNYVRLLNNFNLDIYTDINVINKFFKFIKDE